ncbi:hypothetical protein [Leptospira andrefontaineae]|uniref:Uncharacterized protein n=1 Tax=Leptospira andrefontaineae TaxID=2484976 RepID=A0A4R9GYJ8_9LEPT|nr:hypothetical protein [Leptospira andrefontaineae]TGK36243.1 hypothetical protein EHO65_18240 [Leptospira andrefontaineae]
MKEKSIIFSEQLIPSVIDGSKTVTRRTTRLDKINECPDDWELHSTENGWTYVFVNRWSGERFEIKPKSVYGNIGGELWVRETWRSMGFDADYPKYDMLIQYKDEQHRWVRFRGGYKLFAFAGWKPSIHMPREASRIQLEITNLRVERLNSISIQDAKAEGIQIEEGEVVHSYGEGLISATNVTGLPILKYALLWDHLHGKGEWKKNPWVWVIDFKVINLEITTNKKEKESHVLR